MSTLAITSVTNFLLAGEVLFLAGRLVQAAQKRYSASWYWAGMLLLLGLASLAGGIDHGFFEPAHQPRYWIQRLTWVLLAGMTFCLLQSTAKQFFTPRWQRIVLRLGVAQSAAVTAVMLLVDNFLVVIVNYAPVMLVLLVVNTLGLRDGTGSRNITTGLLVMAAASAVQQFGPDAFSPLDHNGLYHLMAMAGVIFLYRGGRELKA